MDDQRDIFRRWVCFGGEGKVWGGGGGPGGLLTHDGRNFCAEQFDGVHGFAMFDGANAEL